MSYKTQCKNDCVATPADVKRVLQGNQTVLGLLVGGAESKRFGLMETIRPETGERLHHDCILRTTANVKVDEASVLAYEVVRNTDDSYEKLADKVERYDLLLQNKKYLQSNYHGDLVYPQLIICGESLQHNIKIANYLESRGIWSEEDPVLFTDDRLSRNDPLRSIYALREGKKIRRYALPGMEQSGLLKRSLFLSD
ncbi:MAG: hypothetical protein ACLU6W_15445 [Lachnospiraceae bacterium]